ncbi:hypothetical protein C1645_814303 [Glomus cerebriforme]|uniref:Uncharacterized protein n=1 Tax=Glomus cerebriforme TaxID=658196 RepID=A0A397TG41_9GLOM|nr:hypothetical protein C1645_814303 [Glomus cerebriforme]
MALPLSLSFRSDTGKWETVLRTLWSRMGRKTVLRTLRFGMGGKRENKCIQDDFDKSKNENEKLSDWMHQLGEEIRQSIETLYFPTLENISIFYYILEELPTALES